MKRIVCLILSICMLISVIPSLAVFAESENVELVAVKADEQDYKIRKFKDINNVLGNDVVRALGYIGLFRGNENGEFNGNSAITRAEAATLICRMLGYDNDAVKYTGKVVFNDVPKEHWASGYIFVASALGIINGVGDGSFAPDEPLLQEQAVKMIVCALGYNNAAVAKKHNVVYENGNLQYPDAYLKVAYQIGLCGIVEDNEPGLRFSVADVLYNALNIKTVTVEDKNDSNVKITQGKRVVQSIYGFSSVEYLQKAIDKEDEKEKENKINTLYEFSLEDVKHDAQADVLFVDNIVLVYFDENSTEEERQQVVESVNGTVAGKFETIDQYQIKVDKRSLPELEKLCSDLKKNDIVTAASYDMVIPTKNCAVPNDPWTFPCIWNESEPDGANWWLEAIEAPSAWDYNDKFKKIKIGIVDSGFDSNHEDITNDAFANKENQKANKKADKDSVNHGTRVAGIIGAKANNNKGVTGIVWNCDLIYFNWKKISDQDNYNVFGDAHKDWVKNATTANAEYISLSNPIYGLLETVKAGAKVVNFSIGSHQKILSEETRKGIAMQVSVAMAALLNKNYDYVVVQASGNEGVDAENNGYYACITKGNCYNGLSNVTVDDIVDRIIIVGAASKLSNGELIQSIVSNGGNRVDICAPGVDIYSTAADNKYGSDSGTSFAAPVVSSVAALVWSVDNTLTGAEVAKIVCDRKNTKLTVKDNPNSKETAGEFPLVNAKLAVEAALKFKAEKQVVNDYLNKTLRPSNDGGVMNLKDALMMFSSNSLYFSLDSVTRSKVDALRKKMKYGSGITVYDFHNIIGDPFKYMY